MKKNIIFILAVYLILTLITSAVMQDISPRHTVFFLADGILLLIGSKIFDNEASYYKASLLLTVFLCSVFVIRALTPTPIKVWEINNYISFVFAISNLFWLFAALCKAIRTGSWQIWPLPVGISGAVLVSPLIILWGYYFSENAWLNVEGAMALIETNPAEAYEYMLDRTGLGSVVIIILAYLFMISLLLISARSISIRHSSKKSIALAVVFLILNVVLFVRTRDNFVTGIYYETKDYQANYEEFSKAREHRKNMAAKLQFETKGDGGVYVLVIGESENRTRMSAYGYTKPTTPWLDSMKGNPGLILFERAYSCHVQTVPALTYALTAKNQYNDVPLDEAVSLLEVAKAAGYETIWLSNQVRYGSWGTPVSVIADNADQQVWINTHVGNTLDTDFYDGELVKRLDDVKITDKTLIILHLMGSHTSYHSRYPSAFEEFRADGKSSEYDNSVLYTDSVIKELWNKVRDIPNFKGLVYFSDHSDGVNFGVGHNPGTFIFDMAYIPFYMVLSDGYLSSYPERVRQLRQASNDVFTNDLIFNTMLSVMGIRAAGIYEPENDIGAASYDSNKERFTTLYGKKHITEDAEHF